MVTVKELREKLRNNGYDTTELNNEEMTLFNRVDALTNHKGKLVKSFEGKIYIILDIVESADTGNGMVLYKAMYGDYTKYVSQIDLFLSEIAYQGTEEIEQDYRFKFIELH